MAEGRRLNEVEYGVESLGLQGQPESGDLHVVRETSVGALIGVIDGLGHGVEAATAAQLAVRTIEANAEDSLINIAKACHEKLRKTRGAVMALALMNYRDETVTWFSIGNVEGILIRNDPRASPGYETIFMRPGVVGYRLPSLFASVFSISKDDLLIFSTDGIRNDFSQRIASDVRYAQGVQNRFTQSQIDNLSSGGPVQKPMAAAYEFAVTHEVDPGFVAGGIGSMTPQYLASYISRNYAKGTDDALVLVVKYLSKQ